MNEDNELENVLRKFIPEKHLKNIYNSEWVDMFDNFGKKLEGIRGKTGISAVSKTGGSIGIDLMEMSPGSEFPLHTHEGDHILFIIEGIGQAFIDGVNYKLEKGDAIFVPPEYPHSFKTMPGYENVFTFIAIGHPHKDLDRIDRMQLV